MNIQELEQEIEKIKIRNQKVETNKAWETSWMRRGLIVILTYFVITLCLYVIHNPAPWINAIIPSMGFFLSTLTVGVMKDYWIDNIYNKKRDVNISTMEQSTDKAPLAETLHEDFITDKDNS